MPRRPRMPFGDTTSPDVPGLAGVRSVAPAIHITAGSRFPNATLMTRRHGTDPVILEEPAVAKFKKRGAAKALDQRFPK